MRPDANRSYLLADGVSSPTVNLSATSAGITGVQLYTPYGTGRYSTGSMGTTKGYTGQYLDSSGLNYDHARFYDSVVGQFISADPVQGPNRYAYVRGNPETLTDPSGHMPGCNHAAPDGICTNPQYGVAPLNFQLTSLATAASMVAFESAAVLAPIYVTSQVVDQLNVPTPTKSLLHIASGLSGEAWYGRALFQVSEWLGGLDKPTLPPPDFTVPTTNKATRCGLSFAPATPVATPTGQTAIADLKVGEQVQRLDGSVGVVYSLVTVAGVADMWDLTVSNIHTFAVG